MQVQGESARVLITVKASPQPSAKYGDTVCVAGIRLDHGRAEWIRLYPVPFRWMDGEHQFKKYDLVDLDVRRAANDTRPESYRPDIESIHVVGHLGSWRDRQPYMERVERTTTCDLRAGTVARHDAPSLGMVHVAEVTDIEIADHGEWSDAQKQRIAASVNLSPLSLFDDPGKTPPPLRAPRFLVRYHYRCGAQDCPGHAGQILDWELTALQNRQRVGDAELRASIRERFMDRMFGADRETSFFMGNFEDPSKRHGFSVLGVYYPPRSVASSIALFNLDSDE